MFMPKFLNLIGLVETRGYKARTNQRLAAETGAAVHTATVNVQRDFFMQRSLYEKQEELMLKPVVSTLRIDIVAHEKVYTGLENAIHAA